MNAVNTTISSPLAANSGTFSGIINNTNALTNNDILTQNATANINSVLNVYGTSNLNSGVNITGILYFNGTDAAVQTLPTTTSTEAGLKIFWNGVSGSGMTNFFNCAQSGPGGFSWYITNSTNIPTKLMNLDNNCNLSNLKDVSCATITCNTISASGSLFLSGDIIIGNKLTVSNGLVVNELNNESKYFTLKGGSYYGGVLS